VFGVTMYEYWQRTRWSPNAAGWRGTREGVPELVAAAPRQCILDITKLAVGEGTYFDAYVMIDIYSVTSSVSTSMPTNPVFWQRTDEQIFAVHGVPQVVHRDRERR